MDTGKLSDNHRRVISSRVQMIESKILEINQMLTEAHQPMLDEIKEPLSEDEAEELLSQLQNIQSLLGALAERYQLKFYEKSQRAMILSRLSHILDICEDMYPRKLKGYGSFDSEIKDSYNKDIKRLEQAIKQTFALYK